ncbi:MAG: hypothetical protein JWQ97_4071 [Phenylobacterium sp.]|nr:hypothetical protein [Phenylobacterium sp.]
MRFRHHGAAFLAVAALLLCGPPAHADMVVRAGDGTVQTVCAKSQSAPVQIPCHILYGFFGGVPTGVAVDGSGNLGVNVQSTVNVTSTDARTTTSTITAADVATTSSAGQSGVNLVTGTPTAGSAITWALNGQSSATITTSNTFVLTAQIETSADGGTTYAPATAKILGTGAVTGSVTGKGVFRVDVTGMTNIRLRASAFTSGTLTAQLTSSNSPGLGQIVNPLRLLGVDGLNVAGPTNGAPLAPTGAQTTTDRSITITAGGTAQQVMAANTSRRSFYVFNPNAADNCWGSVTSTSPAANAAGSFPLPAQGGFGMETSPTTNAFWVNCPTTSDKVTAWESQ